MERIIKHMKNPFASVTELFERMNLGGFDAMSIVEARRKDIDAILEANRVVYAGAQAVAQKQMEILRSTMTAARAAVADGSFSGTPVEIANRQRDMMSKAFQLSLNHMRDLADIVRKAQAEAFTVVKTHWQRDIDNLVTGAQRKSAGAKAPAASAPAASAPAPGVSSAPARKTAGARKTTGAKKTAVRSTVKLAVVPEKAVPAPVKGKVAKGGRAKTVPAAAPTVAAKAPTKAPTKGSPKARKVVAKASKARPAAAPAAAAPAAKRAAKLTPRPVKLAPEVPAQAAAAAPARTTAAKPARKVAAKPALKLMTKPVEKPAVAATKPVEKPIARTTRKPAKAVKSAGSKLPIVAPVHAVTPVPAPAPTAVMVATPAAPAPRAEVTPAVVAAVPPVERAPLTPAAEAGKSVKPATSAPAPDVKPAE